jgi:hypothetical protein
MDELTDVMAHSVIVSLEHLKKQEKQIEQLFDLIKTQQEMMNNQEKRILILYEKINLLTQ